MRYWSRRDPEEERLHRSRHKDRKVAAFLAAQGSLTPQQRADALRARGQAMRAETAFKRQGGGG